VCSDEFARKITLVLETAIPVEQRCRSSGSEEDEVSFESFLLMIAPFSSEASIEPFWIAGIEI
jgi:hypothetical protein